MMLPSALTCPRQQFHENEQVECVPGALQTGRHVPLSQVHPAPQPVFELHAASSCETSLTSPAGGSFGAAVPTHPTSPPRHKATVIPTTRISGLII